MMVSCHRDPINIDLSDFGETIVIEGNITDQPGPHTVRISRTVLIDVEDKFPPVKNALVSIEDDENNIIQLEETASGVYQIASWSGIPGKTYTLKVIVDGVKYTASSKMPKPLEIEMLNITGIPQVRNLFKASCSFQDNTGIKDYGLLNIYRNGYLEDFYLYQDEMTDGQEVVIDDFDVYYNYGQVATIELLTIDKTIYEFYDTLYIIDEREGDEFINSVIPVTTLNPTTNLDNGALGYFSAHTVRRFTRTL
jgi:hypothetical protein